MKVALVALAALMGAGACRQGPPQTATGGEPSTPPPAPPPMDSSTPRSPSVASSGSSVGPPLDASPTPTGSAAPSSPVSEVAFEGSRLTLGSIGDRCALTFEKGSTVRLELAPPCHVLVWNQPPPRLPNGRAQSGGEPIGRQGDAMAWKYATAHDAKVLAVIGDPVAEAMRGGSLFKLRQSQNFHCAGSLQGVKVLATGAMTTFKRNQTGVYCAETGIDEKDYWMLAHDKEH